MNRRFNYVFINLVTIKFIVFTNGSFANNKNLSFQLEYIIVLINE